MKTSIKGYTKPDMWYRQQSNCRIKYINAIDKEVLRYVNSPMLDIGSGDGIRAVRIAQIGDISNLVLSDPSPDMAQACSNLKVSKVYKCSAEDLNKVNINTKFELITCLWNVLGEISKEYMSTAINNMASLLSPTGKLVIDVSNRYNIKQYGIKEVTKNVLTDIIPLLPRRGKFNYTINQNETEVHLCSYFFSPNQLEPMFKKVRLTIHTKKFFDYQTGQEVHSPFEGHLLYVLKHI